MKRLRLTADELRKAASATTDAEGAWRLKIQLGPPDTAQWSGPYHALFDTGCGATLVISAQVAEHLKLQEVGEAKCVLAAGEERKYSIAKVDLRLDDLSILGMPALVDRGDDPELIVGRPLLVLFRWVVEDGRVQGRVNADAVNRYLEPWQSKNFSKFRGT